MILDHSDLQLVREIALLEQQLRSTPESPSRVIAWELLKSGLRKRTAELQRTLLERIMQNAVSFDGVSNDGMDGLLFFFTDHSPQSPAHGATFVVDCREGTDMHAITDRLEQKRREFSVRPPFAQPLSQSTR